MYYKISLLCVKIKLIVPLQLSYDPLNELKSVLKVVVPDETNGSLLTKTLPVRPHMTTRDVCKIIAHKLRITNPQDYSLFKLIDGQGNNNNNYNHCLNCIIFIYVLYIIK